jgi:flagellin
MLSIQTNYASMVAQNNFNTNSDFQTKTIGRITSGYKINSSADDSAGLVAANLERSQVAELTQGVSNAQSAVSNLQVIDGGLNNISHMLDRLKTLATAGNSTQGNAEYKDLLGEINRQASNIGLGSTDTLGTQTVYIGGGNATETIDFTAGSKVDATSLGLSADLTGTQSTIIGNINSAISALGTTQGVVGSGENKLNYAIQLANSQITNISAAESDIRDADMAKEAANLTKAQVLQQASVAAMAQANTAPQAVLALLKG